MSNHGRALISALNAGDYQAVDQYTDLSDLDLKIVNHHVHELFERAIRTENFKLFRALLKIPRVQVSTSQYCALRHAAKQGLVDFVSDLARTPSVNANLLDSDGLSALHHAIRGGWGQKKALDMVRAILLTPQVKVNLRARDTRTALHMAMAKQWYDVAGTLVDAGGHPKIEDKDSNTPLGMGMEHFGDLPGDLFSRMLSFEDDLPEEEEADIIEAASAPEDDSPRSPGIHVQHTPTQLHTSTPSSPDPTPDPPQVQPQVQQPEPIIRKVETVVEDKLAAQAKAPDPVAPPPPSTDNASLDTVMDGQPLDDTLVKQYLFLPNADQPRIRIHRKAVLEALPDVLEALRRSGQALTTEDARRADPSTGYTLWHAAARHDAFGTLLDHLAKKGQFPEPDDLSALSPDGQSPAMLLDAQAKLQAVLSHELWYQRPQLLTALIAGLPEKRRRSFSTLIAKAHLLLLTQAG